MVRLHWFTCTGAASGGYMYCRGRLTVLCFFWNAWESWRRGIHQLKFSSYFSVFLYISVPPRIQLNGTQEISCGWAGVVPHRPFWAAYPPPTKVSIAQIARLQA